MEKLSLEAMWDKVYQFEKEYVEAKPAPTVGLLDWNGGAFEKLLEAHGWTLDEFDHQTDLYIQFSLHNGSAL